jgi:DNA-binding NarL/FixJ family response regulator
VDIFATRHGEIDLVLTDMGLPRLAGAAMVDALQRVDASVRVIVMSGYLEAEARAELQRKGVRGFLMKPCAPGTVLRTIRTVLTEQG